MKPVVLCILDGFGYTKNTQANAIHQANTPFLDSITHTFPPILLTTQGVAVGLPEGQMGNSEVGHMTIGGGRVFYQNLTLIQHALDSGKFEPLFANLSHQSHTIHLVGMLSNGNVHASLNHLIQLTKILNAKNITPTLHLITDGRDTSPKGALQALRALDSIQFTPGTLSGRYYAMDRDKKYDRTEKYYRAFTLGEGPKFLDFHSVIQRMYREGITDEFIPPCVYHDYTHPKNNDILLITHFRADRIRQFLAALLLPDFHAFPVQNRPTFSILYGMIPYSDALTPYIHTMFLKKEVKNTLPEWLSVHHIRQFHIAETEKYAHVTYFFSGGKEAPWPLEDRALIPSPKVPTYDSTPAMSAQLVTKQLIKAIESNTYGFFVANFANADMVGHTGNLHATIKAVETIDSCLNKIYQTCLDTNTLLCITADHGNAEKMTTETGQPFTAHTLNPVPFYLLSHNGHFIQHKGSLQDISPTLCTLLGLPIPPEMTGKILWGTHA